MGRELYIVLRLLLREAVAQLSELVLMPSGFWRGKTPANRVLERQRECISATIRLALKISLKLHRTSAKPVCICC